MNVRDVGAKLENLTGDQTAKDNYIEKPAGFALFPYEILGHPKSWLETKANLVHFSQHKKGGHFAVSGHCS